VVDVGEEPGGIQAEFKLVDTDRLGQQLADQELEMAVFQGYEFAWVSQRDRQLRALVIVVNEHMRRPI